MPSPTTPLPLAAPPALGLVLAAAARRGRSLSELLWFAELPASLWDALASGALPLTPALTHQLAFGAGLAVEQLDAPLDAPDVEIVRDGILAMVDAAAHALGRELGRAVRHPEAVPQLPLLTADPTLPRERLPAVASRLLAWKAMAACWITQAHDQATALDLADALLPITVPILAGQALDAVVLNLRRAALSYRAALLAVPPVALACAGPLHRVVLAATEREWALARQLQTLLLAPEEWDEEVAYVV